MIIGSILLLSIMFCLCSCTKEVVNTQEVEKPVLLKIQIVNSDNTFDYSNVVRVN